MNHDVFISYSSKNSTTAQAICHELEDNHIKCWMAPRDIPVGAKYASVIAQAIKSCKAVVLVFSEQSAISPWVESEINIAFSNRKPIVPYKIDAAVLEQYDEFYMMLNNRHWIESYPDFKTRFVELVEVVARLVDVELAPQINNVAPKDTAPKKPKAALKTVAKPASVSMPVSAPTPAPKRKNTAASVSTPTPSSTKTYKVGDYYNDGKKEGVVFWVNKAGTHGKIVSMHQSEEEMPWAVDKNFGTFFNRDNPCKKYTGATSKANGKQTMEEIECEYNWEEKFPAFAWCAELGESWYLPAINELKLLLLNNSVHDAVNKTLEDKGGEKLFNKEVDEDSEELPWYWSSTEDEDDEKSAWLVDMLDGDTCNLSKFFGNYVRAVAQF